MCGILLHYSALALEVPSRDYNVLDIKQIIGDDLQKTTNLAITGELDAHSTETKCESTVFDSLVPKILSRGSDFARYARHGENLELFSSVLSLRSPFTEQPISGNDYILQFNGELYNNEIDGDAHANDTAFIFNKLETEGDVIKVIGLLEGEFAYSIYDIKQGKIFFGKDILGKKSLSYSVSEGELYVSSCCIAPFVECLNATVYVFDLETQSLSTVSYNDSEFLPCDYTVDDTPSVDDEKGLIDELYSKLSHAVKSRIDNIHPLHDATASFGILFSGGLDCTILACLAAMLSPPGTKIDLINVSFHNPRTNTMPQDTPDRKLALKSWVGLYEMFKEKGIEFQLVELDIPYEEYSKHRDRVIKLIYPNDTEMDLSIAIAFYFASRGVGRRVVYEEKRDTAQLARVDHISNCKVLLSGLGADELFGGYTRHERIFTYIANDKKRGLKGLPPKSTEIKPLAQLYKELRDELQQDLSNLHVRNLARDDKVISSWSKELRYPFLDTHFISFVTEKIPLMLKLNYNDEIGSITRKLALRKLALDLKMDWVSEEPKRAIQFGAKSAKMETGTGKMKGTDKLA